MHFFLIIKYFSISGSPFLKSFLSDYYMSYYSLMLTALSLLTSTLYLLCFSCVLCTVYSYT